MKILITPHDIIERALWHKYQYLILDGKTQAEIDTIVKENKEFEINERDALVINLVKCIETDNLKHRLNQHLIHILSVKSTDISNGTKNVLCIRKNAINDELVTFLKNFPPAWEPKLNYSHGHSDLKEYIEGLQEKLSKLAIILGEINKNVIEYVQVTHVKKMLNFNH